uniref:Uncharacterized protein n=1 Tax=Mycena chlorophos TaxID=658473 RepID=A0ABQ0L9J1_MYCCL|nr:predicted protein [Mycena chlorophos]
MFYEGMLQNVQRRRGCTRTSTVRACTGRADVRLSESQPGGDLEQWDMIIQPHQEVHILDNARALNKVHSCPFLTAVDLFTSAPAPIFPFPALQGEEMCWTAFIVAECGFEACFEDAEQEELTGTGV